MPSLNFRIWNGSEWEERSLGIPVSCAPSGKFLKDDGTWDAPPGGEGTPGPQGPQGIQGIQGVPGSDASVTKANVEAVLTGEISSHTHAGGGGPAFPIGSVFLSVVNTNPNTLLGYGTWSQIAQGKFLVGQDGGDTNFDVAEETGGAKTHTLTEAEMPAHSHVEQTFGTTTGGLAGFTRDASMSGSVIQVGVSTAATGSGQSHNNLPPYLVVFIWKRIT